MQNLDVRHILRDWVRRKFPYLDAFVPMGPQFFFVEKPHCRVGSRRAIVAVVLEVAPFESGHFEDSTGALEKLGIWTISELGKTWDRYDPTTIENPNFFDVLERTIALEEKRW
jgi:hypothetical protein